MNDDERRTETERRARELFDASVEGVDAATRSRLNRARQAALAHAGRAGRRPGRGWLPVAAAATVAMLAVALWRLPGNEAGPAAGRGEAVPAPEVVEMLGDGEGFDPVTEDPEFYAWLETKGLSSTNGTG